jgi:DNA-binding CsgD family transcriptional regulator
MAATLRAARERIAGTALDPEPAQSFPDEVMAAVRTVVGFDGYCLFVVDPVSGLRSSMHSEHGLTVPSGRLLYNETVERDVNRYADLARTSQAGVLSLGTANEPHSPRLHEILRPGGYASELRLVLVAGGRYWGALSLFRSDPHRPFADRDVEAALQLAAPLTAALRRHQVRRSLGPRDPLPAGVVLTGPTGELVGMDSGASTWLAELTSGGPRGVTEDDALRVVLEVARAAQEGPAVCRVRTPQGRWLVVSGTPMDAFPIEVAVVLQPAGLHQVLPVFGAWCGLTQKEQQVLTLAADGLAAKQIAHRMMLSVLTVNGYLGAAYRKAGVRSRDELLALLC